MKNVCYALLLLSVFLILLGHDLVPHIHDIQAYGNQHSHDGYHGHDADHSTEGENSHTKHNRETSFPYHNHFYSDTDLEYTRINTHHPAGVKQITLASALHSAPGEDSAQQQEHIIYLRRNKPFLIKSLFQPAANPLRGPPSVA